MGLGDLFKADHNHSDWKKRLGSVESINDLSILEDIARTDNNSKVKLAAIKKIKDQHLIAKIALSDCTKNTLHPAFVTICDLSILTDLFTQLDQKNSNTIDKEIKNAIKAITDQEILSRLVEATATMKSNYISIAALSLLHDQKKLEELYLSFQNTENLIIDRVANKLKNQKFLREVVLNLNHPEPLRLIMLKRIKAKDQKFFKNISLNPNQSEVIRITAITKLLDQKTLKDIAQNKDNSPEIQKAALAKKKSSSVITKISIQLTCQECGQPIFVYGPVTKSECHYCNSVNNIDIQNDWKSFIRNAFEKKVGYLGSGQKQRGGKSHPRCTECKKELDVDHIEDGDDTDIECKHCKTLNATFPAPNWYYKFTVQGKHPTQIFCGVRKSESDNKTNTKKKSAKLIMFTCLQCGGALKISQSTPRILTCEYCQTDQYMPDTLWRTLHPIPKKRDWYIRWRKY